MWKVVFEGKLKGSWGRETVKWGREQKTLKGTEVAE